MPSALDGLLPGEKRAAAAQNTKSILNMKKGKRGERELSRVEGL